MARVYSPITQERRRSSSHNSEAPPAITAAVHPPAQEDEGWAGSIPRLVSRAWIDVMLTNAPEPLATMCGSTCFTVSQLARRLVDITDTFEMGVGSLKAHPMYIDGLGWENFEPAGFLEARARQTGTRLGVPMAVGFELYDLGLG